MSTISSSTTSEPYTSSEWTRQNMLQDLMQQKWFLVGAGSLIAALWLFSRRSSSEQQAARRLVRDWRNVDDAGDVRGLLGQNVPVILRPLLLTALEQLEDLVEGWFRRVERDLERL